MARSPYREAVDAAVKEAGKPLADLTPDEVEVLYERALGHFLRQAILRGRVVVVGSARD